MIVIWKSIAYVVAIVSYAASLVAVYYESYIGREPSINRDMLRQQFSERLYVSNDRDCHEQFRMNKTSFNRLCSRLKDGGLCDSRYVKVEEQVAIFLITIGHDIKIRHAKFSFIRSGETISHHFNNFLRAVLKLCKDLIKPPNNNSSARDCSNTRSWHKYFEGCVGAIDDTFIRATVPLDEQPGYRNRKRDIRQNVLAACTFDMKFTYILAGWEGSAHDGRVLRSAQSARRDPMIVPSGMASESFVDNGGRNKGTSMIIWSSEMDRVLIDTLMEQMVQGNKFGTGWKPCVYTRIITNMRESLGVTISSEHIRNRLKTWKVQYCNVKELLNQSGFGWDDTLKMVTAPDSVWADYVKKNPKVASYRSKQIANFNDCSNYWKRSSEWYSRSNCCRSRHGYR